MENLSQYALNKRYAEDTANRVNPTAEQFRNGIEFKSEARSNTLNGNFYLLSQAIQYLQFTGGLYDNNASYNEGNIVSCVVKDVNKYRLWRFRRNSNNAGTLTGNAPINGGSIESINGVDVYVLGSVSGDWDKLEDFNYSSEATPNFIISRDNEGSAKVEMPSVVDDKSVVNKSYLKAINVSYEDNKSLGATDVQNAIDKLSDKLSQTLTLEPYFIQYTKNDGTFDDNEAPNNWYKKMYGIDTTWELMFNTESVYFRTEGSLASSSRSSGVQGDAIRNITGSNTSFAKIYGYSNSGCITVNTVGGETITLFGGSQEANKLLFDASFVVPTANENRTVNRLIRVYHLLSINGVNVSDIIGE